MQFLHIGAEMMAVDSSGPESQTEGNAQNPRILIIDDMPENIRLLVALLKPEGYVIDTAEDGIEALRIAADAPPDVVLLDFAMPGMDGIEVCSRLKKSPQTANSEVIMVTGSSEHKVHVRSLEAGADDFLHKPIESAILRARVRRSIRTKRLLDANFAYQQELKAYNEQLEARIHERTQQVVRTQHVTVFALAKLSESRDNETGVHLERMSRYTLAVAREMSRSDKYRAIMTQEFLDMLFFSSPLHDIGKVGIPDAILLKPGKLTRDEFEIMKLHTVIGGRTLDAANDEAETDTFLEMGRDIAYAHHEKWDGNGYPNGLRGLDIPLPARVTALGDVYDALTSRRPYKEPFSHEKAKAIIVEGKGSHFDPDVVDAFLAVEDEFIAIAEAHQDEGGPSALEQLIQQLRMEGEGAPTPG